MSGIFDDINTKNIFTNDSYSGAKIKIIGVGGGGGNALNSMLNDNIKGVDFIVANTDAQALNASNAEFKITLGTKLTRGLGAGANPEIGKKAAQESSEEIKELLQGTDLVFVAAGLGGGTGSGAAPVIAQAAKEAGSLVVGIVTTPFSFEGKGRIINAKESLEAFSKQVDSIIVISNDRLLDELGGIQLKEAFKYSDAILKQAIRTITDIIKENSRINLDFADVKAVIENQGSALIGVGRASGENAAVEAAIDAIRSPILESSIEGAKKAIINVAGSSSILTIQTAQTVVQTIKEAATSELDVIFGLTENDELGEELIVSIIATGLQETKSSINRAKSSSRFSSLKDDTNINKYKEQQTTEFDVQSNSKDTFEHSFNLLDATEEETIESDISDFEDIFGKD